MEKMKKIKVVLVVVLVIVAVHFLFKLFSWQDARITAGAEKYENCIKESTGKNPAYWYEETGAYPVCESNE